MDLYAILVILYVVLVALFIFCWLTRHRTDRQAIVKNSIELMVMVNTHFTDSEKLRLLVAMINDIDLTKIPDFEIDMFVDLIEKKYWDNIDYHKKIKGHD